MKAFVNMWEIFLSRGIAPGGLRTRERNVTWDHKPQNMPYFFIFIFSKELYKPFSGLDKYQYIMVLAVLTWSKGTLLEFPSPHAGHLSVPTGGWATSSHLPITHREGKAEPEPEIAAYRRTPSGYETCSQSWLVTHNVYDISFTL